MKIIKLSIIIAVLLIFGCRGGNNDNTPLDDSDALDYPPINNSVFNANKNLAGLLFVENKGYYYDLSTGLKIQIEPDDATKFQTTPSPDGSTYVVKVDGGNSHGISIKDMQTGLTQDYFEISETLYGGAKISYDLQYVAAIWRNERVGEDYDEEKLTIFDRKGEVVSRSSQMRIGSFDWLPDGKIVYTDGKEIYLTPGDGSAQGKSIADLSDESGSIWNIKASPDGSQFAFEMVTKSPGWLVSVTYRDATTWLINSDGSNPRLFATSRPSDNDEPSVVNPLWATDGQSLIMTEGYFSGVSISLGDIDNMYDDVFLASTPNGLTYNVPLKYEMITLPPEGKVDGVRAVFTEGSSANNPKPFREIITRDFSLVPAVQLPNEKRGSLAQNELQNLGLSGKLYYLGEGSGEQEGSSIKVLDIITGEELDQCVYNTTSGGGFFSYSPNNDYFGDTLGVSKDGSLFSIENYEYDNETIKIYDRDCQLLSTLEMDPLRWGIISNVRFSPLNYDLIAFAADDENDNDRRKVVVRNWKTNKLITFFMLKNGELGNPLWMNNGGLLMPGKNNKVYISRFDGDSLGSPEFLFELPGRPISMKLSPDGSKVVFRMARQIWSSNIDGSNLMQHTSAASNFNDDPVWSPDGNHILLQNVTGSFFGELWIIASDAEFVRIYEDSNFTKSAIPLLDSEGSAIRQYVSGSVWLE